MKVITARHVTPFDVDNTLIVDRTIGNGRLVQVWDEVEKKIITLRAHEPMIRLLKEEAHRGSLVWVWSRGGHQWAKVVLNALGIEKYVDIVSDKPHVYFDDIPIEKWLCERVWLDPNTNYKR